MTQHYLKTTYKEKPVIVQAGWDRRMQGFYLVVDYVEERDRTDPDQPIFSNLSSGDSHPKTFVPFDLQLEKMGVVIPNAMRLAIIRDGETNTGNGGSWWTADGRKLKRAGGTTSSGEF